MLINLSFIIKRFLRNGRRHWDSFCEYTELPGFRFMTSKVTYIVSNNNINFLFNWNVCTIILFNFTIFKKSNTDIF
ncbi:unnamed protein product [Meloidogyne enterolobii]|uniref:Uncharacterized protein n=1 Tax=Meloidogyne enterolobii TaxID=390850 RepID=A0ACB0YQP0_MELEN